MTDSPASDELTHLVTEMAHGATRFKLAGEENLWTRDTAEAQRWSHQAAKDEAARLNEHYAEAAAWCSYGTRRAA